MPRARRKIRSVRVKTVPTRRWAFLKYSETTFWNRLRPSKCAPPILTSGSGFLSWLSPKWLLARWQWRQRSAWNSTLSDRFHRSLCWLRRNTRLHIGYRIPCKRHILRRDLRHGQRPTRQRWRLCAFWRRRRRIILDGLCSTNGLPAHIVQPEEVALGRVILAGGLQCLPPALRLFLALQFHFLQ